MPKARGNGQGSVYKEGNTWTVEKTFGYYMDGEKRKRISSRRKGFRTKAEALEALHSMQRKEKPKNITFYELSELLIEHQTSKGLSRSAINCNRAAIKWFADIYFWKMDDISIDELQGCVDACPCGRRTQENMKTVCGMMYKYAIIRKYLVDLVNVAQGIIITAAAGDSKAPFTEKELEIFRKSIGVVPYADYIYALCYLGFRPSEFLNLKVDDYDPAERAFIGGSKTDAGKGRTVTISPKIQPIVDRLVATTIDGHIFHYDGHKMSLKKFRDDCFYPALKQMGIKNDFPKRTPHSCRHSFANLIKNIRAADKDKLELIGHANTKNLRYYQTVDYEDLRNITDQI